MDIAPDQNSTGFHVHIMGWFRSTFAAPNLTRTNGVHANVSRLAPLDEAARSSVHG